MEKISLGIIESINEKCDYYVDFVLNWLNSLPGLLKLLVLASVAFLILLGALSLLKKSFKLLMVLAIVFSILMLAWTFLSK